MRWWGRGGGGYFTVFLLSIALFMMSLLLIYMVPVLIVSSMLICAAHVLEESHDADDGVKFLSNTRADWKDSFFGGHLIWHLCLNYFGMIMPHFG